ncbi:MAG: indole-3-glycerol phosphate synthase TrpC, partial [Bacteroidota bacterium]
ASALSVLTDQRFFQGQKSYIRAIKSVVSLPLLRKDFIIDEYQVYESRYVGADAILLIVSALSQEVLKSLYQCARSIGLDVLVETHTEEEIARANEVSADIIGINNRNLATFEVSLQRSLDLRSFIDPRAVSVSESGIQSAQEVAKLRRAGFDAILVGEGLVTSKNRVDSLRELVRA